MNMTQPIEQMLEELQRRNYSPGTIRNYLRIVKNFGKHFRRRPEKLGPNELRRYQVYLLKECKLAVNTVVMHVAALRFFFTRTLKIPGFQEEIPYPKCPKRKPTVLSRQEVAGLINAAGNLKKRALLMTYYGTGVRRTEGALLKVTDIDSARMMVNVECGKGGDGRSIPLSPILLETLREYYKWYRPKGYLFPSNCYRWREKKAGIKDKPISGKTIWNACRDAARHAGIKKHVTPHTLRHSFATHLLEDGADLPTLQKLLGHADIRATEIYTHLSARHLRKKFNLLENLKLDSVKQTNRCYHRKKGQS
jgi:integrase/recombinase XerD